MILVVVEGVANLLPVDSTAHALLVQPIDPQGYSHAVVPLGAALAVLAYFWRDVLHIGAGLWKLRRGRIDSGARLAAAITGATVPALVAYWFLPVDLGRGTLALTVAGWSCIVFAIVLAFADGLCMTVRRIEHLTPPATLAIGIAQVAGVLPGIGRAGMAVLCARMMGYERPDAQRFSLLVSAPALVAVAFTALAAAQANPTPSVDGFDLTVLMALSFLVTLGAVAVVMSWVRHNSLVPFVIYRVLLGIGLLALARF